MLKPLQSLRKKGYQHLKIATSAFETFVSNLKSFKSNMSIGESEEYHKTHLMDFFKNTYFSPNYLVAQKGDIDFVIHSSADSQSAAVVLFEVKSTTNKSEMITTENLNKKAMQEILLYYLRERVTNNNLELKYLVVTNTEEFFIFDAHEFERVFFNNVKLRRDFNEFAEGQKSGKNTDFFYQNIAKTYIEEVKESIEYVHFNIKDYTKLLDKDDDKSRRKLSVLYKILSPNYLLKQSVQQDHNSLNKNFYNELLYIIGLEEVVIKNKRTIRRLESDSRIDGSIIENTITKLDADESLSKIHNPSKYGADREEQLFNVALELSITWINRILFLKLLEAQLIRYNGGDINQGFLNPQKVKNYDELYELFFQVLAVKYENRKITSDVPYLNSSLFEISKLEHNTIKPSNLNNDLTMKILPSTILKDKKGKLQYKELPTLEYLFRFLDAYDFGSESESDVQDDNKALISASVLGLIFEKINGYKDGAIFTPSFVTMYMCRESIVKAVVDKFNAHYGWSCTSITDLYNNIDNIEEANNIINSITICDPAVGSGHFLVSALNEIIRIKHELNILSDSEGKRLKGYGFDIINDELIITDDEGNIFTYNKSKESQRIQETIFKEKQKIIENCLFGVDINPNSVNICRLRLWIELLKNTYYTEESGYQHLETLPNIDINIKCGNSLLSKYDVGVDIKSVLSTSGKNAKEYRSAVLGYKTAPNKEKKREFDLIIDSIKHTISTGLSDNQLRKSETYKKLSTKEKELYKNEYLNELKFSEQTPVVDTKKIAKLRLEVAELRAKFDQMRTTKTYENSFEWRFEFPEVWNDDGDFVGFDLIIGNPPYIQLQENEGFLAKQLKDSKYETFAASGDIYCLFYELGIKLLKDGGIESFITSSKWMRAKYGEKLRSFFTSCNPIKLLDLGAGIFDNITADSNILFVEKRECQNELEATVIKDHKLSEISFAPMELLKDDIWTILPPAKQLLKSKIKTMGVPLRNWDIEIYRGVLTGYNEAFMISTEKREEILLACKDEEERDLTADIIKPVIRGKDIQCYQAVWADKWLIATYPAKGYDIELYPALKAYLMSMEYERLEQSGRLLRIVDGKKVTARKKTSNKWFEVQDNIAYWKELEQDKIVWKRIGSILRFSYDTTGGAVLDSTCFATGADCKFLVAIFNSKMGNYMFQESPKTGTGDLLVSVQAVEPICVPKLSPEEQQPFIDLVDQIIAKKQANLDEEIPLLEAKIDRMVYDLYNLTDDEINLIELTIKPIK